MDIEHDSFSTNKSSWFGGSDADEAPTEFIVLFKQTTDRTTRSRKPTHKMNYHLLPIGAPSVVLVVGSHLDIQLLRILCLRICVYGTTIALHNEGTSYSKSLVHERGREKSRAATRGHQLVV